MRVETSGWTGTCPVKSAARQDVDPSCRHDTRGHGRGRWRPSEKPDSPITLMFSWQQQPSRAHSVFLAGAHCGSSVFRRHRRTLGRSQQLLSRGASSPACPDLQYICATLFPPVIVHERRCGGGVWGGVADTECSMWCLLSLMHFMEKRNNPKGLIVIYLLQKSVFVTIKMLMNLT